MPSFADAARLNAERAATYAAIHRHIASFGAEVGGILERDGGGYIVRLNLTAQTWDAAQHAAAAQFPNTRGEVVRAWGGFQYRMLLFCNPDGTIS